MDILRIAVTKHIGSLAVLTITAMLSAQSALLVYLPPVSFHVDDVVETLRSFQKARNSHWSGTLGE